ncbi:hypothetical protein, partial [Ruminococcus flavefaciens]|uniref:hypothetical protein n=1 Tax=Ruminococcus flavefaciens TaxID=1265 RepID=UPI0026F102C8
IFSGIARNAEKKFPCRRLCRETASGGSPLIAYIFGNSKERGEKVPLQTALPRNSQRGLPAYSIYFRE